MWMGFVKNVVQNVSKVNLYKRKEALNRQIKIGFSAYFYLSSTFKKTCRILKKPPKLH